MSSESWLLSRTPGGQVGGGKGMRCARLECARRERGLRGKGKARRPLAVLARGLRWMKGDGRMGRGTRQEVRPPLHGSI